MSRRNLRSRRRALFLSMYCAEPLEGRVLFAGTPFTVDLQAVGTTPVTDVGDAQLTQGKDSFGNFQSFPTPRLAYFQLSAPLSDLSISEDAANKSTDAKGDLHVQIVRDANADGQLDQSELNQPMLDWVVPSDAGAKANSAKALPAGAYFANLSITNFVGGNGVLNADVASTLTLSAATVTPANIKLTGGGTIVADNDTTPTAGDGTDFGAVNAGAAGVDHAFTVTNTGGSALTLGTVSVPSGFELESGLPASLAQGQSANFTVRLLSSGAAATHSGQISFTTNAAGANPFNFTVKGTVNAVSTPTPTPTPIGTPTPAPMVSVFVDALTLTDGQAAPVDFGTSAVGGVGVSKVFTVQNVGDATLALGAPVLPSGYTLAEPLDASLAPAASDTFTVQLDTTAQGTFAGTISFATNDATVQNPFDIPVTGAVGTATPTPTPTPTASSLAIQSVSAAVPASVVGGQKKSKGKVIIRLINNSDAPVNGPEVVTVYASLDATLDTATDTVLIQTPQLLSLKPHKTKNVSLKFAIGVPPIDGDYLLLANVNGVGIGDVQGLTQQAPNSVHIARPVVTLTAPATLPGINALLAKPVKLTVSITNSGNVPAIGTATINVFLSPTATVPDGTVATSTQAGTRIAIKQGTKNTKLRPFTLPSTVTPGSYFFVLTLTADAPLSNMMSSNGGVLTTIPVTIA